MKIHCVTCGKPETKTRVIDSHYHCEECRKSVPEIQALNIDDASNLSQISFKNFKDWLTGTLQITLTEQFNRYAENLQSDIETIKTELAEVKRDLASEKSIVATQKKAIADLHKELNEVKQTNKDTTKYLINIDRNSRQHNAVLFGVSESDLSLKGKSSNDVVVAKTDSEKVQEILRVVQYKGEVKQFMRLGKKGDRPRPIKLMFDSPSKASSVIANSSKLKDLVDVKIYVKPDKTKKENDEFKRIGDKKRELLEKYPTAQGAQPRVILQKGVLTLDGVEVTRYQPIQTLF